MSTIDEASIIHGNISCGTVTFGPWNINEDGHIIPESNASFDIGTAECKVRHLFLSQNSLQIGDTALSEDTIKRNTRLITDPPTSHVAPGTKGDIANDDDYIYFCFMDNKWSRVMKSPW
jgi:hypothetical protein